MPRKPVLKGGPTAEEIVRYGLFRRKRDPTVKEQTDNNWRLPHSRSVPERFPATAAYKDFVQSGDASGLVFENAARQSPASSSSPSSGSKTPSYSVFDKAAHQSESASSSSSPAPKQSLKAQSLDPSASAPVAPSAALSPEQRWDIRGDEKWKEFIDERHHGRGRFGYDEYNPDGQRIPKAGGDPQTDQYYSFLRADALARDSLGQPMSADLYKSIHKAASSGLEKQDLRKDEVRWRLAAKPTREQVDEIAKAAPYPLKLSTEAKDEGRMVNVPALQGRNMEQMLQKVFAEHYQRRDQNVDPIANIAQTYKELETLHPGRDGTARTNHLVLNKLLTEAGHTPITLHEPNSPTTPVGDVAAMLREKIADGRTITPDKGGLLNLQRERGHLKHFDESEKRTVLRLPKPPRIDAST